MVDWLEAGSLLRDIRRFPEFCAKYLRIQPTRGGRLIPLQLNRIQRHILDKYIVPTWRAGRPVRLVVLKCRQSGVSTLAEALGYWFTIGRAQRSSLVIGETVSQASTIFRMMKRYNDNMPWNQDRPDTQVFPVFPQTQDSLNTMNWARPSVWTKGRTYKKTTTADGRTYYIDRQGNPSVFLGSTMEVKSADTKDALGRAGTYQFVHASEAARWPDLTSSLISLISCCHPEPQTCVIIECTANGMNAFHGFWNNLQVGDVEVPSIWQKVFIPWYWREEYELPLEIDKRFEDEYEEGLFERIETDEKLKRMEPRAVGKKRIWAKLFWRRRHIRDVALGDVEYFKQEFPATDSEAFMFTGVSCFGGYALHKMEKDVCEPIWRGNVEPNIRIEAGRLVEPKKGEEYARFVPHDFGRLKVYQEVDLQHLYAMFADVAEGKAVEGVNEDRSKWDFSCAQIFRVTGGVEQVAVWHGNCDPDSFGDLLVAIARRYNMAYLAWEVNGPGRVLKSQIVDKHRYRNIFMRDDIDSITKRATKNPGWLTTGKTKPYMVGIAQRFVRNAEVVVHDGPTLSELKAYSRVGENKYEAAQGHDDRTIAFCGCCAVIEPMLAFWEREHQKILERLKDKKSTGGDVRDYTENRGDDESWNPILGSEF